MVARGPGEVGCAHCTKFGATQSCQVCTRLVCDACANDWTTCAEPAGREIRLGMSARVHDVDPHGRRAIVRHLYKPPRFLDLRELRWLDECPLARHHLRFFGPHLTANGLVVHAEVSTGGDNSSAFLIGVHWRKLDDDTFNVITKDRPQRASFMSKSNELVYVDGEENAVIMAPPLVDGQVTTRSFHPLPYKVIHALCLTNDILVSGTWREIAIDRISGDESDRLSRFDTKIDGNVEWLALAGNTLAYAARGTVQARHIDADYRPLEVHVEERGKFGCASLSGDGRYLAIGFGKQLVVYDVDTRERMTFDDHTDTISFIRFAHDHLLITADDDNRVILRPRAANGYARAIIAANLPD